MSSVLQTDMPAFVLCRGECLFGSQSLEASTEHSPFSVDDQKSPIKGPHLRLSNKHTRSYSQPWPAKHLLEVQSRTLEMEGTVAHAALAVHGIKEFEKGQAVVAHKDKGDKGPLTGKAFSASFQVVVGLVTTSKKARVRH